MRQSSITSPYNSIIAVEACAHIYNATGDLCGDLSVDLKVSNSSKAQSTAKEMDKFTILVGNDINNIAPGISWSALLTSIKKKYNITQLASGNKPFPMLYEEIFLNAVKTSEIDEKDLKSYIGESVSKITPNDIHDLIRKLPLRNIITTNYEFSLEGTAPTANVGLVKETTYSVFRQYQMDNKSYWHIHGDCSAPISINLGYEHYCGQLQKMRDYVANGPNYSSKKIYKEALIRRLNQQKNLKLQSWVDLFFTHDVHILGLSLDFVEIDLWWLLTYRARNKYYKKSKFIKNELYYYVPKKYEKVAQDKLQLLKANDVKVIIIDESDKTAYYKKVIKKITAKYDASP